MTTREGMRVRNKRAIERFPHFCLEEIGKTGTVREWSDDLVLITMDEPIPGCEEWENDIVLTSDEFVEYPDVGITVHNMEELFAFYFESLPSMEGNA